MFTNYDKENRLIGVFLGLSSANYEYIARIISPYQLHYQPEIGSFLLIDSYDEYIVARIMDLAPRGELTTFMGEKWLADVALYDGAIGQDIKKSKISYQVKIKLLGRFDKEFTTFSPGLVKIPHMTSQVLIASQDCVQRICNQAMKEQAHGIELGHFYLDENIKIHFNIRQLVGKRTFIFARAGYGKSNLMKIIASNWKPDYGSLIIFDPEGEYSITDKKGRPGILDQIPAVLFTNRKSLTKKIKNNIYPNLKVNLKKFRPSFIIPQLIVEEKHTNIFYKKLLGLNLEQWGNLVELFAKDLWRADEMKITEILKGPGYEKPDDSVGPIANNLVYPIKNLHDSNSKFLEILEQVVNNNQVGIIDISLLGSQTALQLASIIVQYFFHKNQRVFVGEEEELKRIVFVIEEAQSVLGSQGSNSTFVELAKEGRKYQLGGIFITQQPGAINKEILSQGDNFFVFHMINKGDLNALNSANAHYSDDILTQILNEPIPGKAYIWSSPQPFVIPVKINNFEELAKPNNAVILQERNPILNQWLTEIDDDFMILKSIKSKLYRFILASHISLKDKDTIENKKVTLSKKLFKALSDSEHKFVKNKDLIWKNKVGEEIALKYTFLFKLVEELRIEEPKIEESNIKESNIKESKNGA